MTGRCGALVVSLDFELQWGVRDRVALDDAQRRRLLVARSLVPRILDVFAGHSVHATWATVGALFAKSREHFLHHAPQFPPVDGDRLGNSEREDPFHFAPSLIALIESYAGQEIGCHSFTHYCSLEPGHTGKQFRADLESAIRLAAESKITLRSYVFPRNEVNPAYFLALEAGGFSCYRSNETSRLKAAAPFARQQLWYKRLGRLADSYIDVCGPQTHAWPDNREMAPIASSRYLRPFSPALRLFENLRYRRITQAMEEAALRKRVFHLWWHPEDFADYPEQNLAFLGKVLDQFSRLRDRYGMSTLTMHEAASAHTECQVAIPADGTHG